jgi:hypothetical protein
MLVAGVKGTQFSVIVRDDLVAVEVVEGHVEVQSLLSRDDRADLFAGDLISLRRDAGRLEVHGEDRRTEDMPARQRSMEMKDIRKDTKSLTRGLAIETSTFNVDALWNERMIDRLEEKAPGLGLGMEDRNRLFEEKQSQKITDDVIKILCGGSKNWGRDDDDRN